MTGRRVYATVDGAHEGVGFDGIKITAGGSSPVCIPDPWCPPYTAFSLQLDTWKLNSAGPFPGPLVGPDGLLYLPQSTSDSVLYKLGGHPALTCSGPGKNAIFKLAQ